MGTFLPLWRGMKCSRGATWNPVESVRLIHVNAINFPKKKAFKSNEKSSKQFFSLSFLFTPRNANSIILSILSPLWANWATHGGIEMRAEEGYALWGIIINDFYIEMRLKKFYVVLLRPRLRRECGGSGRWMRSASLLFNSVAVTFNLLSKSVFEGFNRV